MSVEELGRRVDRSLGCTLCSTERETVCEARNTDWIGEQPEALVHRGPSELSQTAVQWDADLGLLSRRAKPTVALK